MSKHQKTGKIKIKRGTPSRFPVVRPYVSRGCTAYNGSHHLRGENKVTYFQKYPPRTRTDTYQYVLSNAGDGSMYSETHHVIFCDFLWYRFFFFVFFAAHPPSPPHFCLRSGTDHATKSSTSRGNPKLVFFRTSFFFPILKNLYARRTRNNRNTCHALTSFEE